MEVSNTDMLRWYVRGGWTGEVTDRWGEAVIVENISVDDMHTWHKANPEAFIAAFAE